MEEPRFFTKDGKQFTNQQLAVEINLILLIGP
jgi:hypothetical protein